MASQQQERPITYGDVFAAQGYVGEQPVTREDASLMQSLETMALGSTPKGGVASAMQSAADRNMAAGAIPPDAHTIVAEQGMTLEQATVPGMVMQTEYVAGQPVAETMAQVTQVEYPAYPALAGETTLPTDISTLAIPSDVIDHTTPVSHVVIEKPVTIGEAMEAAAVGAGDTTLEDSDARAIQSAETRALGQSPGADNIGAVAQSAVATNEQFGTPAAHVSLSDVLEGATARLPSDKVVTPEDAAKVMEAELRGRPTGVPVKEGGVADCVQAAADVNTMISP
ncbi:hypothetical protein GOP47_0019043 [Adiantum capillus-veneris]|uniref:SMP domain-containing protein n=1 Tax=Adiantum capillus-veneris TaxID=13818 RepID=A0A9D4UFK2_ADICA|nr:hypothetical protein GOP47_0019043 [Adiantum capillus-veneris]